MINKVSDIAAAGQSEDLPGGLLTGSDRIGEELL